MKSTRQSYLKDSQKELSGGTSRGWRLYLCFYSKGSEKEFSGGLLPGLTGRSYRFWSEDELRSLCELCGLENFKVERENRFIMFCATKPAPRSKDESDAEV